MGEGEGLEGEGLEGQKKGHRGGKGGSHTCN